MSADTGWAPAAFAGKYGGAFAGSGAAVTDDDSALPAVAGPSEDDDRNPLSPDGPLFWFAVLAAAAVGLMYASTTVRVGPVKASASVGSS